MRLALALLALAAASCKGGLLYAPSHDAGCTGPDCDEAACEGPSCPDACGSLVCPPGAACVDGLCRAEDRCAEVRCHNPGEVCDPRDGTCRSGASDDDGDGYTIAEGDCDDGAPEIHPGAEEVCDGVDQDCDLAVDEDLGSEPCSSDCGPGERSCRAGEWQCSAPRTCECTPVGLTETEACGSCGSRSRSCRSDYSWSSWSPCAEEGECTPGATGSCLTSCGSAGARRCGDDCRYGPCAAPAETCNGVDDDCDGECDEGCRVGVHRCYNDATGDHMYTPDPTACSSDGFRTEWANYFYVYPESASVRDTAELWLCFHSGGHDHFLAPDSSCEGATGYLALSSIGRVGTRAFCGAVPLHRLWNATGWDHFYTLSEAEVAAAESLGYVYEFVAGQVWTSP